MNHSSSRNVSGSKTSQPSSFGPHPVCRQCVNQNIESCKKHHSFEIRPFCHTSCKIECFFVLFPESSRHQKVSACEKIGFFSIFVGDISAIPKFGALTFANFVRKIIPTKNILLQKHYLFIKTLSLFPPSLNEPINLG